MQLSIPKELFSLVRLFPQEAIGRQEFARFIANSSGFLAGVALIQLDDVGMLRFGRYGELALAFTGIISIFVVLHTLGQVATAKDDIAKAGAHVVFWAVVGAAISSLPDLVVRLLPRALWVPETIVLACVVLLLGTTLAAARANFRFPRSSKFRTVSVSTVVFLAETSCVIGLILEFASLRRIAAVLLQLLMR